MRFRKLGEFHAALDGLADELGSLLCSDKSIDPGRQIGRKMHGYPLHVEWWPPHRSLLLI